MQHLKEHKNDDKVAFEKLKEDPAAELEQKVLMSKVAGDIFHAIEQQTPDSSSKDQARKAPPRSAKSLKRDAALDKLTKVMNEQHHHHHHHHHHAVLQQTSE